ncbi:MAG: hypothetical protein WD751_06580 [Anaerolineales bacterium]
MKTLKFFAIVIPLGLLLVACGSTPPTAAVVKDLDSKEPSGASMPDAGSDFAWMMGQSREDAQGSVTVIVTAQTVNPDADTIEFAVLMDTHSVELDMDLASLSTLTSDSGVTVSGMLWDAPLGGHHGEGTLSFPASVNGVFILDGATQLTLTIRDVDAAERVFTWQQ